MKHKLFFDLDGTLVNNWSSWVALHNEFGTREKAIKNHEAWLDHQDAHKWAQSDLLLFKNRSYLEIINVFENIKFFEGVKEWFPKLQEIYDVYLISGGFGLFVEYCANELNIPDDHLIYHSIYVVDDEWKIDDDRSFNNKSIIKEYSGYKIAVGNGQNDIDMFKEADYPIGFNIEPRKHNIISPHIHVEFKNDFSELAIFLLAEIDL